MNWWDDPKYKRLDLGHERTVSVTDTPAAKPVVTKYNWFGPWLTCECCGKDFKSKRRVMGVKFCSNRCRQKHYRQTKERE